MKENIIQILVHEKTKDLAVCRGIGPSKICKKVKLEKELSQKEIDESIINRIRFRSVVKTLQPIINQI